MKKNKFADEIIVRLRAETEKREACLPGSPYLIDELIAQFERTEARLTLTEAALSAAGELLGMSTADFTIDNNSDVSCDFCETNNYEVHEETCPYHQAKERWDAAREALK